MVRNLTMVKGLPCNPGRNWRKKMGAPNLTRTSRLSAASTGGAGKRRHSQKEIEKSLAGIAAFSIRLSSCTPPAPPIVGQYMSRRPFVQVLTLPDAAYRDPVIA